MRVRPSVCPLPLMKKRRFQPARRILLPVGAYWFSQRISCLLLLILLRPMRPTLLLRNLLSVLICATSKMRDATSKMRDGRRRFWCFSPLLLLFLLLLLLLFQLLLLERRCPQEWRIQEWQKARWAMGEKSRQLTPEKAYKSTHLFWKHFHRLGKSRCSSSI